MRVTIDLTEAEVRMVRGFCLLRPMQAASDMLLIGIEEAEEAEEVCQVWTEEDKVKISEDLHDSAPIFENIRHKLVNALAVAAGASTG